MNMRALLEKFACCPADAELLKSLQSKAVIILNEEQIKISDYFDKNHRLLELLRESEKELAESKRGNECQVKSILETMSQARDALGMCIAQRDELRAEVERLKSQARPVSGEYFTVQYCHCPKCDTPVESIPSSFSTNGMPRFSQLQHARCTTCKVAGYISNEGEDGFCFDIDHKELFDLAPTIKESLTVAPSPAVVQTVIKQLVLALAKARPFASNCHEMLNLIDAALDAARAPTPATKPLMVRGEAWEG